MNNKNKQGHENYKESTGIKLITNTKLEKAGPRERVSGVQTGGGLGP